MEPMKEDNNTKLTGEVVSSAGNPAKRTMLTSIFRFTLPLVALLAGGLITVHLLETGPEARPLPKKKNAILVETTPVELGTYPTTIAAMGVVKAAQVTELKPQVNGEVISISEQLLPGGRFVKDEPMLQLDPRDYQLTARQQASAVAQARNNLEIEDGNQLVARRELDLLGEQVSETEKKLMLRQPQLNNLQTALEIAEAQLEQAKINLARTAIHAPFNGIIQSRDVNIGTWVSSSTTLATLIGTDRYWVEVSVPEEQLQWVVLPQGEEQQGSLVKIYNPTAWSDSRFREGRVVQLLPGLETQGRMARLLIEVEDPMAMNAGNQGKPPLLIDSYVRVAIEGKSISQAIELSREYLRDGKNVWVFEQDGTLAIREVSIVFKNQENALITSGISEGDEIVISGLSAPVSGMLLRRLEDGEAPKTEGPDRRATDLLSKNSHSESGEL